MHRLLTIIFIVALAQCSEKPPLTFGTQTKEIFFNGDVQHSGKNLIEFYLSSTFLSLDPRPEGYTTYPPLSALGEEGRIEERAGFNR